MAAALQPSLFDHAGVVSLQPLDGARRTRLSDGAWIDFFPGWLTGAGPLFDRLVSEVPWRAERRPMYERVVDVPRLVAFYDELDALPDPIVDDARSALGAHYRGELDEAFATVGMCY